ncbi:MAG: hypothetical protein K6B46_04040 [Opitutales bacterium]|nr:hypothetical protein [Opitutales bacterium]
MAHKYRRFSPILHKKSNHKGFSLVVALLLMSLIITLGISITTFITLQSRFIAAANERSIILNMAREYSIYELGRLQEITGRDSVITVEKQSDSKNLQPWVYAIDAKGNKTALVSNAGDFSEDGKKSFRLPNGKIADVPWKYSKDGKFRFASIVIDEGVKPSLGAIPPENFKFDKHLKQFLIERDYSKWFRDLDFEDPCTKHFAIYNHGYLAKNLTGKCSISDFTSGTYTVLADWPREVLKEDLSNPNYDKTLFGDALKENKRFFDAPDDGLEISCNKEKISGKWGFEQKYFLFPIETKLHIVFFNARTDGQHRSKFYLTTTFWNPYSCPLNAQANGYFTLTDWARLPSVKIENLDTGSHYEYSLSDFPQGQFGNAKQTASDKTFNAYNYIYDSNTLGLNKKNNGFHSGEIYESRYPDPQNMPQGLSRITGMPTWKRSTNKNPNKTPSGVAGPDRWFHNDHTIVIKSISENGEADIVFRAYVGNLKSNQTSSDYSFPLIEFKNVPIPDFEIRLSGAEYNRVTANINKIEEAQIVFSIRFRIENETAIRSFFEKYDLRNTTFDFKDPIVSNVFEIKVSTDKDLNKNPSCVTTKKGYLLFDEKINTHDAYFSCFPFFDNPNNQLLSVGLLRHFYWSKIPQLAIGHSSNFSKSEKINEIYDRYYFSGLKYDKNTVDFKKEKSKNPYLVQSNYFYGKTENPEKYLLASGVLNINSEREEAWELLFRNKYEKWQQILRNDKNDSFSYDNEKSHNLKNTIFTRPFSAQAPLANAYNSIYSDNELEKKDIVSIKKSLISQGLRQLTDEKIKKLSEEIVKEIKKYHESDIYFNSLEMFINEGILEKAIKRSDINNIGSFEISSWIPNYITQQILLDSITPAIAPRSDTFKIIVYVEKINPFNGTIISRSGAELSVQRTPEAFEGNIYKHLGRKYKIINFRWL